MKGVVSDVGHNTSTPGSTGVFGATASTAAGETLTVLNAVRSPGLLDILWPSWRVLFLLDSLLGFDKLCIAFTWSRVAAAYFLEVRDRTVETGYPPRSVQCLTASETAWGRQRLA